MESVYLGYGCKISYKELCERFDLPLHVKRCKDPYGDRCECGSVISSKIDDKLHELTKCKYHVYGDIENDDAIVYIMSENLMEDDMEKKIDEEDTIICLLPKSKRPIIEGFPKFKKMIGRHYD